jgi:hypothetical protein
MEVWGPYVHDKAHKQELFYLFSRSMVHTLKDWKYRQKIINCLVATVIMANLRKIRKSLFHVQYMSYFDSPSVTNKLYELWIIWNKRGHFMSLCI